MSEFTGYISELRSTVKRREELSADVTEKEKHLGELEKKLIDMLEAQSLLAVVSEDNTTAVLDYITGVINKALAELFPYDTRRIYLLNKLHADKHPHIILRLVDGEGHVRNLTTQSGTGLRQVISFLYNICLVEIRKGRRIFLMDELLSGLHDDAKAIVLEIINIFAEEGFQFIMVEYGVNNFGKIYLVEKPNKIATVSALDGGYDGQVFEFNKPEGYEDAVSMLARSSGFESEEEDED